MKNILLMLFIILAIIETSAKTIFPFKEVNNKCNLGIIGGYLGYGKDISNGGGGVSFTIKGFYGDVMGWPPSHEKDMGVSKWPDKTSVSLHVGYQIPILKCLRFIPVIGFTKVASGTTDGSNYTISSSGTIHNKFSEKESISGLDFGGIAVINIKKININLACTKYTILGGIAMEF